jgi:hypothetical protein
MMSIKILFVIDGIFRFAEPSASTDFTFTALVNTLTAAGYSVTKANRASGDATADISPFNFASSVNLLDFDMIWMIGYEGRNSTTSSGSTSTFLTDPELTAIATFMEAGGGVFATGDHDSIGATMAGKIPRIRAMRSWFGLSDSGKPAALAGIPDNFPSVGTLRADTTLANPGGNYPAAGHATPFVWFENQSDSLPQTITPVASPAHPILRRNGYDIVIYPDHMHEGQTHGVAASYNYLQNAPYGDTSKAEFRTIAGHQELPQVIANGQGHSQASYYIDSAAVDATVCSSKTVNALSIYEGRVAGVGRIVTGSTFHHYIDINLTGASNVNTPTLQADVGPNAAKGHGLTDNGAAFSDIQAVYRNITLWLARPARVISLILERSTFSQDEVTASSTFSAAILVTVDGLKPSQFPGGGVTTLSPSAAQLTSWAPVITPSGGFPIAIEPTGVSSDDPTLPDRLQRLTFTYQVRFTGNAFTFMGVNTPVPISASLQSTVDTTPVTNNAWLELVKSANPFMLDLADGNTTSWLSSDVKVFHVVEGQSYLGQTLANNASRDDALTYLRNVVSSVDTNQFTTLPSTEGGSVLSSVAYTTASPPKRVYNFALARVRLSSAGADANAVRVFFRIFTTQTTAALTYHLDGMGLPVEGYLRTASATPIALPGTQNGGTEWLTFPFFSADRLNPPSSQTDGDNLKDVHASTGYRIFGVLIDNNLDDAYLTQTPVSGGAAQSLPTLLMGEHQCVVAQIEYPGAPIPDGANPATSDKLSQRNLAVSTVANPGLTASRVALHTFEIEATPYRPSSDVPPDELLLQWPHKAPEGSVIRLHIPTWQAQEVLDLADQYYARHEIHRVDAHTIELPANGSRYIPIPRSMGRQTGVIEVELPLGIRKGQRFDVSVTQLTNRNHKVDFPQPRTEQISLKEAAKLLKSIQQGKPKTELRAEHKDGVAKGVFELGDNKVLVTDLSVYDATGDHALIVEFPDPARVKAAQERAKRWRQSIGSFQLGIPVSTKKDMLPYQLQLLSVMRWRVEHLSRKSRFYKTMRYYLEALVQKIQALGGDPYTVPPTPTGLIPLPGHGDHDCDKGGDTDCDKNHDGAGLHGHPHGEHESWTGKVCGLKFDHFGEFEGFTVLTKHGTHHDFYSRAEAIYERVRDAWDERCSVTVYTDRLRPHHVYQISVHFSS